MLGSLSRHLLKVADHRSPHGKVHSFHAALCLVVVGLLCSQFGLSRTVAFAQSHGARRRFSGPRRKEKQRSESAAIPREPSSWIRGIGLVWRGEAVVPSLQTILRLLAGVKASDLEAALGDWMAEVVQMCGSRPLVASVDGKNMNGCEGTHVLSAFIHDVKAAVWHRRVDSKRNELSALRETVLELIARHPALWLLRADAIFADRSLCELLTNNGREYFFAIKDNQPNLREKLEILFSPALCAGSAEVTDEPEKRGAMRNSANTTAWTGRKSPPSACPA